MDELRADRDPEFVDREFEGISGYTRSVLLTSGCVKPPWGEIPLFNEDKETGGGGASDEQRSSS